MQKFFLFAFAIIATSAIAVAQQPALIHPSECEPAAMYEAAVRSLTIQRDMYAAELVKARARIVQLEAAPPR